ncbi:MAG: type II toxin-antitoxin system RelE/ParE family toxin [Rhodospirillales bacterium]|nr:type II toxin-antitoxin system RelE/ParE family toxin [Rhodospirillales bacterium]
MYSVRQTDVFEGWLSRLGDGGAKARILARIDSAKAGNLGDTRRVARGVWEMRIHTGPGYRVYFTRRGDAIILLLCGGPKKSQRRDIKRAVKLLAELNLETHVYG